MLFLNQPDLRNLRAINDHAAINSAAIMTVNFIYYRREPVQMATTSRCPLGTSKFQRSAISFNLTLIV